MLILLPIPIRNLITNQIEDVTVSLVSIEPNAILKLDEDLETKNAIIYYKSGAVVETVYPFIKLVEAYTKEGLVNFLGAEPCRKISKSINTFLTNNNM